jgi:hypothetical protein
MPEDRLNGRMDDGHSYLEHCLRSSTVDVGSAETHRASCESSLRNALHFGHFDHTTRKRLERLLASLVAGQSASPQRKVELITQTLIPTLEHLHLVDAA